VLENSVKTYTRLTMAMIKTMLITNDPLLAAEAREAGIDRLMVDLETIGKKERQASRNTFISAHRKEDIASIRSAFDGELVVRINPWHENSPAELDHAVAAGADLVMLPMITELAQIDAFLRALAGRARPLPLIETEYSMRHLTEIAARPEITELYIGLNDLHLSLGMEFLFEPLAVGLIDQMAQTIKALGKAFGFGGIAAMGGGGELPPENILAEHVRLGSGCVILSSRFGRDIRIEEKAGRAGRLKKALADMQQSYYALEKRTAQQRQTDFEKTSELIMRLARSVKEQRKRQS
jgi:2-keto-3-deoxy-L-rhamnonate aldolase RhmA